MNGKITWYNDKMGFGFIASPAGGIRLFLIRIARACFPLSKKSSTMKW